MSVMLRQNDGHCPSLNLSAFKDRNIIANTLSNGGTLSPDVKPPGYCPNFTLQCPDSSAVAGVKCVGNYILLEKISSITVEAYRAVNSVSQEEFVCKVFPLSSYRETLAPYWRGGSHQHIVNIEEIILGATSAYVLFKKSYEDLHSYIRTKRRLKEKEAAKLFSQIASSIKHCHKRGIVLRDIKLRKFVFIDQQRTWLAMDGLEDACLLDDIEDDTLTDKHGCPAYVSPEILSFHGYSGRSADIWSLGVILYTMLFGQYPFHDTVASQLFGKIRRGYYTIPDSISSHARCLVRSLLRTEPSERLTIKQVCLHPWFSAASETRHTQCAGPVGSLLGSGKLIRELEQRVPDVGEARNTPEDIFGGDQ